MVSLQLPLLVVLLFSILLSFNSLLIKSRQILEKTKLNLLHSNGCFERLTLLFMSRKGSGDKLNSSKKKYSKENLPVKTCKVCGRPFEWRKKWEKVWDEVKYCSERCRRSKTDASLSRITLLSVVQKSESLIRLVLSTCSYSNSRKLFNALLFSVAAAVCTVDVSSSQRYEHPAFTFTVKSASAAVQGSRPSKEEINSVFSGEDWDFAKAEQFSESEFRRLDDSPDAGFYTEPRFVEHIDKAAVAALTKFQSQQLTSEVQSLGRSIDVLDLCSSWVSHVPSSVETSSFTGLGMNMAELERNQMLTSRTVQDLNTNPILPYESDIFDAVLIQLSIDYLTKPVDVMKEISRVLRPNGLLIVTFSNRVFIDKAVAGWTGKADIDHIERVGRYIESSGGVSTSSSDRSISSSSRSSSGNSMITDTMGQFAENSLKAFDLSLSQNGGDPLYAVIARAQ